MLRKRISLPAILTLASLAIAYAAPSSVVYITKTGTKYHEAGCRFLRKSAIKTTVKAAREAGNTPCSKCKPPQS
jgi:hypothetical protein